jgi:hypothetical protein
MCTISMAIYFLSRAEDYFIIVSGITQLSSIFSGVVGNPNATWESETATNLALVWSGFFA